MVIADNSSQSGQSYTLLFGVLAIGLAFFLAARQSPTPAPKPTPAPAVEGLDLREVFLSEDRELDKHNAYLFASICGRIANTFDIDSKRAADRRVMSGEDIGVYRADVRFYTTSGWKFSAKYPLLPSVMTEFLDKTAGDSPEELTPDQLLAWARAFRTIQQAALYCAESR